MHPTGIESENTAPKSVDFDGIEASGYITKKKVDFIEASANQLLAFRLESRQLLVGEAHSTMKWFFGIITATSGYAITLIEPTKPFTDQVWVLIAPLAVTCAVSILSAFWLLEQALRVSDCASPGNEPNNLMSLDFLAHKEEWGRFLDASTLQARIDHTTEHNKRISGAINLARQTIISLPLVFIVVLLVYACFVHSTASG